MRCLILAVVLGLAPQLHAQVTLSNIPNRGIQPQAVLDEQGNLHLLYFEGEPRGGNLMYVRRDTGKKEFTPALRVNSQPGSAVAMGTIRGGQIVLGKKGRVHIAWNGSMAALPKNPISGHPMLYARLNDAGTKFEEQRNLMTRSAVLDGGGTLAADDQGIVYVAWHGLGKNSAKGESQRQVWVSVSQDEGKTFASETSAWDEPTGACGCCGMRGLVAAKGGVYFLYRSANPRDDRGMYVLHSSDQAKSFTGRRLDHWNIDACPMSSESLAMGPHGMVAAWDKDGQIFFNVLDKKGSKPTAAPGSGAKRKHPALAFNAKGSMILVWTEGTGWNRGGDLAWQVYDQNLQPTESGRRAGAIPVWGLPTVVADGDGRFVIFH